MVLDLVQATRLIGPGMAKTAFAQLKRKSSKKKSSRTKSGEKEVSHDEAVFQQSLRLLRNILEFTITSTVEDLHAVTGRYTPATPWVHVQDVEVPSPFCEQAASLVQKQLGPNLDKVGPTWWQWRKPGSPVRAQWIEMKVDYEERMAKRDLGKKVMFYIHGGAYYLGGIGHDVQIQRHARKLKGRCFAPRYRLAPQFPFPCAVQDVVSAYLYLLTIVEPSHIVLAGDSAGAGLCLALLQIIRDQGLPMPAGASLISPWVDLTHSFPSITMPTEYDYVPAHGFHAKPSLSWPPPTPDEMRDLGLPQNPARDPDIQVVLDGQPRIITDQINMYAPNTQLFLPLVSPVLAATLGGFCPCQVITGGAEVLRDEQIFLAHKMADPTAFPPSEAVRRRNLEDMADVGRFPPTETELLVFDDGPHAAPTLGHIEIAKHQYRAVSQFAGRVLARAQGAEIEIEAFVDEDDARVRRVARCAEESSPARDHSGPAAGGVDNAGDADAGLKRVSSCDSAKFRRDGAAKLTGLKAGDALPPPEKSMLRYRVNRRGDLYRMEAPDQLRALQFPLDQVGQPTEKALSGWLAYNEKIHTRFASEKRKIFEKRQSNAKKGYITLPNGEVAPPTALVGRRVVGAAAETEGQSAVGGATVHNGVLGRLFSRVEKGGPAAEGRVDTMADMGGTQGGAGRASRTVRPGDNGHASQSALCSGQEKVKGQKQAGGDLQKRLDKPGKGKEALNS